MKDVYNDEILLTAKSIIEDKDYSFLAKILTTLDHLIKEKYNIKHLTEAPLWSYLL